MSVKVCYQDYKGQIVTKYFNSERSLIDTLWSEVRKIDFVRKTDPNCDNELYLRREKYLLDLMDHYASPQTKREWKYWEEKAAEQKRLLANDAKYLAQRRAEKKGSAKISKAIKDALARKKVFKDYECCTIIDPMETPEKYYKE